MLNQQKFEELSGMKLVQFSEEFSQEQETLKDSIDFMKKMVYIATVQILHMRDLMPDIAFEKRRFDDTVFYSLNVRKNALAHKVAKIIKEPIEAIDRMALKTFTIVLRSENNDEESGDYNVDIDAVWHEVYSMQLAFNIGGSIIVRRERDNTVMLKLEYTGPKSVQEQTSKLMADIAELSKALAPLPDNVEFGFQAKFFNDPVGVDGFHPDDRSIQLPSASLYKCLGGVVTGEAGMMMDVQSIFLNERALSRLMTPLKLNITNDMPSEPNSISTTLDDPNIYDGFEETYLPDNAASTLSDLSRVTIGCHRSDISINTNASKSDILVPETEQENTLVLEESAGADKNNIKLVPGMTSKSVESSMKTCSLKSSSNQEEDEEEESTFFSMNTAEDTLVGVKSLSTDITGSSVLRISENETSLEIPRHVHFASSPDVLTKRSEMTTEFSSTTEMKARLENEMDSSAASRETQIHSKKRKGAKPMKPGKEIPRPRQRFVPRARPIIVHKDVDKSELLVEEKNEPMRQESDGEQTEMINKGNIMFVERTTKGLETVESSESFSESTDSTKSSKESDSEENEVSKGSAASSIASWVKSSRTSSNARSSLEVQVNTERKKGIKPMNIGKELPRPRERYAPRARPIIVHSDQQGNETVILEGKKLQPISQKLPTKDDRRKSKEQKERDQHSLPAPLEVIPDVGQRVMEMDDHIVPRLTSTTRTSFMVATSYPISRSPASSQMQHSETITHPITLSDVDEVNTVISQKLVTSRSVRFSPYPRGRVMVTERMDKVSPKKEKVTVIKVTRPKCSRTERL